MTTLRALIAACVSMRLSIVAALFALLLCAVVTPAWVDEPEVDPRDARAIAIEPIAKPREGKNVALSLEIKSAKRLPRGLSVVINGRQVKLTDDGRWPDARAGDGIFSVGAKTSDGQPLKEKTLLRLDGSAHHVEAPAISCTLKRVECPKDCKSAVFGSRCVLCFELTECTISFLD
jgi:hypothetical protein